MQQNGQNNLQIKISEKGHISKQSNQNVSQEMLHKSIKKIDVQTKENQAFQFDHTYNQNDEKQKHQIFEEPNIQSMMENNQPVFNQKSTFGSKNVSEHLSEYYEFFADFDLKNKDKIESSTQILQTKTEPNTNKSKIKIKSKYEIRKTLFEKGIYIQSLSEKLTKKNQKFSIVQLKQQNKKVKHQRKRQNIAQKQRREDGYTSQQIQDDSQSMSKWIYFQQNLTNEYHVQKLFQHIQGAQQFQSGDQAQQNDVSKREFEFFESQYNKENAQTDDNREQQQKKLNFKILQIRSTFSPEAFDIICSVGQIYILKISLLINLNDSLIHKHIIYNEGSYGNIYLLNGKINSKKQHPEYSPCQINENETYKPSEFHNINSQDANDGVQINKDFFIVKCFKLRDNQMLNELLHSVLKQYCMNFIMSALEIGPKVVRKFGFDLMVYPNCIEYCLEFCQNKKRFEQGKSDIELKAALLTMHQINLIHLDIKPDNIAFSRYFNKWVFLDFGFSDFVIEKLGEKTFLCYVGTYEYSSPEMKKALTSDNYVDLYFNDIYALKRSFIFMDKFEEVLSGSNSSVYYNHTVSLLLSIEIHHNFIEQVLIITRLKYFLLRENLTKSCFYLKCLLKFANDEQKFQIGRAYEIKNAKNKIKRQVEHLFPLLLKQNDFSPTGLSIIKEIQDEQENWIEFEESKLKVNSHQNSSNELIGQNCNSMVWQSKKMKSSKAEVVRFYKSLILTEFYVDFYYEHISILIEDFQLHMQIQKKIKSNLIHSLVKCESMVQQDIVVLKKIKQRLFYNYLRKQFNQIQGQDQLEENIDFDKLYALSLSLNQHQYAKALLAKKSIPCENQNIAFWKQKFNTKKGIMNLKQKLLDKKFLDNLSQEEYFNLYYRYVTFKKNIYKAKLSDKIMVSNFFIKYWKINRQKYHNFQTIFEEFICEEELKDFEGNRTVVYSENDTSNIPQTWSDQQERKNYQKKVCKTLSVSCPLYSILICFRFIIANCIYIHPSNIQKRELFTTLICEYFLIDDSLFTYQNDFNFMIPWCKIIVKQHSFFKNEEQAIQYLCKDKKIDDVNRVLKEAKMNQNFLQLLERLWRMNQSSRVLNHRLKPINMKYSEASYYKEHIEFILKDRKNLKNHFSSEVAMQKFMKIISIEHFVQYSTRVKEFEQFFLLEEDLKIVKSEILKNKNITDMTKINLLKLISLKLFTYDTFIQEAAKISQVIEKQKDLQFPEKFLRASDFNTAFKDEALLLKSSKNSFQESYVISNAKKVMLELVNTPFSCTGIEDFHFHLVQRLRMQGKFFECQSIIKLIDRTINCKEISDDFLISERRFIYYYIEKDELTTTQLFERSVNQFSSYEMFCNISWLDDLITFSSIFLSQQPIRINGDLQNLISKRQRDEYMQNNPQYAAYQKFLKVQQDFVKKLKKYIKTSVLTMNSNLSFVFRNDYNNFFSVIKQSLIFLKTQPSKQIITSLSSEGIFKNYETKKDFFYDVFQKALPFCSMYMNKISKNPLVRRFVYNINQEERDFKKEFRLMKLQAQGIKYFEQRKYMQTITLIYENLEDFGIKSHLATDPMITKLQYIKCLLIYVKAFFVQYRLKTYCWYEKYNNSQAISLKISYSHQGLIQFIQKQGNAKDENEKKYELVYKQILKILYLYLVSTGQFLIAMQFNAPTLQFLIETAKNVGDERSYFQICLYLVSISRYMSKHTHFRFATYVMGNIEEFANKNIPPITKPLFEYLIKFTKNIITHHYEDFSSESKEWKNPNWWLFVNIFLKYSSIDSPIVRKMLVKIASVLGYLNFRLRDHVSPLFYINYLRFKDMETFKGKSPLSKLKNELRKLHRFQSKRGFNQANIHHYLRIRVKSFNGISPINYHQTQSHYSQNSQNRNKDDFKRENCQLTMSQQVERFYFFCMRFEGIEKELNFFHSLSKKQLKSPHKKEQQSQNIFLQDEKEKKIKQKKRQNLVRRPSICRSDVQFQVNEPNISEPKVRNFYPGSFRVGFSYEFKKKVQEFYFKEQESSNLIQSQPQISFTKGRILRAIIEKIYVQQKNIGNIHFEENLERILAKKKAQKENYRNVNSNFNSNQFTESEQI